MGKTKTSKHRGGRTHGRGKKAGRGAGKRGGRGMAGSHKHRFVKILISDPKRRYFGMHGFKRPQKVSKAMVTVNIIDLARMKEGEHIKVEKGKMTVDLEAMGIDKLLGTGTPTQKYQVRVGSASAKAIEKIEGAGGKVQIVNINTKDTNVGAKKK